MSARRTILNIVLFPLCLLVLLAIPKCIGYYRAYSYMAPYREYIRQRHNMATVIAREGKPLEEVASKEQLDLALYSRKPLSPIPDFRGGRAIIYPADPYNDGEGYLVILLFDKKGIITNAVLAL